LNGIRAAQPSAWIAESLPLPTLGAVLQQAHFFIGHDSGLTHLAAAVGTPSLALFGPTLEAVWAPPAPHVQVVRRGANIGDISVDDVLNAIAGLETKQIKN
jgi:ADP-heptose:LPS heptosyltransferase